MDWKRFIILFLRNVVIGTALGGLLLGVIGFLLAGRDGFVNLAIWGLALGLVGSFSGGFAMLLNAHIWTGYSERIGRWVYKKQSEGEDKKSN